MSRRFQRSFTSDGVRQRMEVEGWSLMEAKARLSTEGLLAEIADLRVRPDVGDQLEFLMAFVEGLIARQAR